MPRRPCDDRYGPPDAAFRFLSRPNAAPDQLTWLWPGRLPLGAFSLLIGDPGVGKSLLTADLAARVSVPLPWPDDPAAERPDPASFPTNLTNLTNNALENAYPPIRGFHARTLLPAGVLFAAPEDHAALPDRLTAAGVERFRISILDGVRPPFTHDLLPLRLPAHIDQLDEALRAHDHPRLVILDPIHLLLDDAVHSSPSLQTALLARLTAIARSRDVAILAVGHFAKTYARRILYRIRGSLAFVAAARSILLITTDPDAPDRRILTQIKNAYAPISPPLAFRITETPLPPRGEPSSALLSVAPASRRCSPSEISNLESESVVPRPFSRCSVAADPRVGRPSVDPANCVARANGQCSPSEISNLKSQSAVAPPSRRSTPLPPSEGPGEGRAHSPAENRPEGRKSSPAPRLAWEPPTTSDWRLSTGVLDLSPESFSALSEACDWLTDFLASGPRPAREILTASRTAGIPRTTLFRAKQLLNIPSQKQGPTWTWLPSQLPSLPGRG